MVWRSKARGKGGLFWSPVKVEELPRAITIRLHDCSSKYFGQRARLSINNAQIIKLHASHHYRESVCGCQYYVCVKLFYAISGQKLGCRVGFLRAGRP